jgi:hypothetical protein
VWELERDVVGDASTPVQEHVGGGLGLGDAA